MRSATPPALVLLVLFGLLCALPSGLTLCIHRDGHVRVESAAFPCCGDREAEAPVPALPGAPEAAPSSCADCVDVPVPSLRDIPGPTAPDRPRLPDEGARVLALPFACADDLALRAGHSSPSEVPRGSLPGLLLASVVLRC
jgi:hypothetical protein